MNLFQKMTGAKVPLSLLLFLSFVFFFLFPSSFILLLLSLFFSSSNSLYQGSKVLYTGDHIFADIIKSKKVHGWRNLVVVPELEHEIQVWVCKTLNIERRKKREERREKIEERRKKKEERRKEKGERRKQNKRHLANYLSSPSLLLSFSPGSKSSEVHALDQLGVYQS